jgi:phosphoserine phosphatase RsbX
VPVTFGIAQRVCQGETVCGDAYVTHALENGALISVVDGLGHGPKAGEASTAFVEALEEDLTLHVQTIMEECHRRLSGTRGAAAAILRIDDVARKVSFTGIGNIEMHAISEIKMHPVCAPGIVGHRVRKMLSFEFDLPSEALVMLASDGISSRLHVEDYAHLEPQEIADTIMEQHGKAHDDATIVVARYTSED